MSAPSLAVVRAEAAEHAIRLALTHHGTHPEVADLVIREAAVLVDCVTTADDARRQERTRRVQAEALLAQLTTPSPTTPEPETVPL